MADGYYKEVADKFIQAMKDGTAPWIRPWEAGLDSIQPVNAITGKPYRGINMLNLTLSQLQMQSDDPRWCTYRQAQELGAQVREGSHGVTVQYWQWEKLQPKQDSEGNVILGEDGQKQYETVPLAQPRVFFARVFNASQIENMPPLPARKTEKEFVRHERAEKMLAASQALIFHDQKNNAFYDSKYDEIHLPPKIQFESPDSYYATALHELGHWSGHESRLAREGIRSPFGSEEYAREELRAELGSYMLGMELKIGHDPGQHQAYVSSWIKALENDPKEIVRAARDAQTITDYVLAFEKELTHEKTQQDTQTMQTMPEQEIKPSGNAEEKTWLNVPFRENRYAKAAGAKWDGHEKRWYAPDGADIKKLNRWLPGNQKHAMAPPMATLDPRDEFAEALRNEGLIVERPMMDGRIHRVPVEGGKTGAKDGSYVGFLDNRPAGWITNFKTGHSAKWTFSGHRLTKEAMLAQGQQVESMRQTALAERRAEQAAAANTKKEKTGWQAWLQKLVALARDNSGKNDAPPVVHQRVRPAETARSAPRMVIYRDESQASRTPPAEYENPGFVRRF